MTSNSSIKKLLGKRLQEIRKSKKMTQEQIADLINIDPVSLSNIESGRYFPSADNLDKLIDILSVNPSEIFCCEYNKSIDSLISEMTNSMKNNEKLAKLMYKFYLSVKY